MSKQYDPETFRKAAHLYKTKRDSYPPGASAQTTKYHGEDDPLAGTFHVNRPHTQATKDRPHGTFPNTNDAAIFGAAPSRVKRREPASDALKKRAPHMIHDYMYDETERRSSIADAWAEYDADPEWRAIMKANG